MPFLIKNVLCSAVTPRSAERTAFCCNHCHSSNSADRSEIMCSTSSFAKISLLAAGIGESPFTSSRSLWAVSLSAGFLFAMKICRLANLTHCVAFAPSSFFVSPSEFAHYQWRWPWQRRIPVARTADITCVRMNESSAFVPANCATPWSVRSARLNTGRRHSWRFFLRCVAIIAGDFV